MSKKKKQPYIPFYTGDHIKDTSEQALIAEFLQQESSSFGPPALPGVYGVYVMHPETRREHLIYIGCSENVRQRVMQTSHPYRIAYDRLTPHLWVYTKTMITERYIPIEKILIQHFRPILNINGKKGVTHG